MLFFGRTRRAVVVWAIAGFLALVAAYFLSRKIQEISATEHVAAAARRALLSGRHSEAAMPVARFLKARPGSAEAHALAAQLALEQGDLERVTTELNRAKVLGYPKRDLERLHAATLTRIGRYAEAEPILVRLHEPGTRPDALVDEALARLYLMTYRLRQAEEVIKQWIHDAPQDGRPYLWLTEFDRRMEVDNSDALETHYRQALARDPELDPARLGLAETLRKVHRNTEAAAEYDRYLDRHPDDAAALAGAGRNDIERAQPEAAAERLDRALEREPRDPDALKGRAELDIAAGEPRKAKARLDLALEIDPFDTEALYSRGRIRSVLGDPEGAKQDLESFKKFKNDHAELLKLRGRLMENFADNELRIKVAAWMFEHGREADGLGWARAVLASNPDHTAANLLLADYYSKQPTDAGLANFYRLRAASAGKTVP
jgi:tetratricopeptide (TPR) repeat protein